MSAKKTVEAVDAARPSSDRKPCLIGRWGRGRIGGTAALMLLGQRARAQSRPVKFLDGDLKSATLTAFYNGECSRPASLDPVDFRAWVLESLDQMEADRVSRLLDVSGGSSSMEELLRDLELPEFCEVNDFEFAWLCVLGPDLEDFEHVRTAVQAGHMKPRHMVFALNEGAIRQGQNPVGAFEPVTTSADFMGMMSEGANAIYVPRLSIMEELRKARLDFYSVAEREPLPDGTRPRATWAHMVSKWLGDVEARITAAQVGSRMP